MLSFFECMTRFSWVSIEHINITDILDWIFQVSDFLRSFMISFKCGLNLLKYSSIENVLFLLSLLSESIWLLFQKLATLTGLL